MSLVWMSVFNWETVRTAHLTSKSRVIMKFSERYFSFKKLFSNLMHS